MNTQLILALVRHLLTFLGGTMVTKGVLDQPTLDAVLTSTDAILGAGITLVGAVWSYLDKRNRAVAGR